MNDVQKQMVLGALRTILGVAGGAVLVKKGFLTNEMLDTMIGALMILIPIIWSVLDKHWSEQSTQKRELNAINAGIVLSNTNPSATMPVTKAEVKSVIETFGDKT